MRSCKSHTQGLSRQGGRGLWRAAMLGGVPAVAALVCALMVSQLVHAADFACPSGDVHCLIDAINTANANGEANTITLAAGTYPLTAVDNTTDEPAGLPSVTSPLTLTGAGADATIIERAASAPPFRLLHVAATGALTLDGLTLRGGVTDGIATSGGALLNRQGTVTLIRSTITNNTAQEAGGGLVNDRGTMTLTGCRISGNTAVFEGGGIFTTQGTLTLMATTITGNRALTTQAGGIFNDRGTLLVTASTIANNSSTYWGGGLYNEGGAVTLTNSTLARNQALEGGGLLTIDGTEMASIVTLINSTLAANIAVSGGGLANLDDRGGTVAMQNTLLARNSSQIGVEAGPDCFGPITSLGTNLVGDITGCTIALQPSDLTGDPGLGPFADDGLPGHGHVPLLATSQAIDAGSDEACPETDQLGQPRVGPCDIGAIEFQPLNPHLVVAIDIKPGDPHNRINRASKGRTLVAILSQGGFDATQVDPASLRFGPAGATVIKGSGVGIDVDGDTVLDLLVAFQTQATGLACGDTSATLTGLTRDGQAIQGSDAIQMEGCGQEVPGARVGSRLEPVEGQ